MHPLAFGITALSSTETALLLGLLIACVILYLAYKVFWRHDFGVPVRRRIFCRGLRVERDQVAFVPLWWSDLQIQRAVKSHWKASLRQSFTPPPPRGSRA